MDYLKLSKEVSYALRHAPWEYELEIDDNGWVNVNQLLMSLKENNEWKDLNERDLYKMIETSDKKRCELLLGKIRALYGHSIPQKILKEAEKPPEVLYHGTSRRFWNLIYKDGLIPKARQYVHLSVDIHTALQVGKRRDDEPIILRISANQAYTDGIVFYQGNDKVWLSDFIPNEYISKVN